MYPRSRRKRTPRIIICAILALGLILTPIPSLSAKETAKQTIKLNADEQTMLGLVNKIRAEKGFAPLQIDTKLQQMARNYGREMINEGFFGHESPSSGDFNNRIKHADIRSDWLLTGENLASTVQINTAFDDLMNSPRHRANILEGKFTHTGIGVVNNSTGKMVVQEFAQYPKDLQPVAVLQSANEILVMITGWMASVMPTSF